MKGICLGSFSVPGVEGLLTHRRHEPVVLLVGVSLFERHQPDDAFLLGGVPNDVPGGVASCRVGALASDLNYLDLGLACDRAQAAQVKKWVRESLDYQ